MAGTLDEEPQRQAEDVPAQVACRPEVGATPEEHMVDAFNEELGGD